MKLNDTDAISAFLQIHEVRSKFIKRFDDYIDEIIKTVDNLVDELLSHYAKAE